MIKEFLYYNFKQVYPNLKISDARNSYNLYLEEDDIWIRFNDSDRLTVPYENCCYVREDESGQLMSGYFNYYLQDTTIYELQKCLDYLIDMYHLRRMPQMPSDFDFKEIYDVELKEYLDRDKNSNSVTNDEAWDRWIELLDQYKGKYKTTDVPKTCIFHGKRLGAWVRTVRDNYNTKNHRLTDERIQQLEGIGFVFDSKENEWNVRFELYKDYVAEKGSFYIPKRTVFKGDNLGVWVMTQKMNYRNGKLSEKRIILLLDFNANFFE